MHDAGKKQILCNNLSAHELPLVSGPVMGFQLCSQGGPVVLTLQRAHSGHL